MWVKFTAEHWHRFNPRAKRRFLAGTIANVPAYVGNIAINAGRAVKMKKPNKAAAPEEDHGEASGRG